LSFLKKQAISGGVPSLVPANVTVAPGATLGLGVGASPTYFDSTDVNTVIAQMGLAGSNIGLDTTAGNFTHAGAIAGGLGVAKLGSNTLTLTGANTYTGPTTVSKGTLAIGALNSLPAAPTVNIGAAGTLSSSVPGVTITGGTLNLTAGHTLSTAAPGTIAIDGTTTINGDLHTAGDGMVTLSGVNYGGNLTVAGNTTVTGGTLTGDTTLGANGSLTVDGGTMTGSMYVYGVRWSSPASLTLTNGAQVGSASALAQLGGWAKCDDNSAVVTGTGTVWTTGANYFNVGAATSRNTVLITDGGKVVSTATDPGYGFSVGSIGGDDNVVTIQDGGTWDLTGGGNDRLVIGNSRGGATDSNLVEVKSGGSLLNVSSIRLGVDARNNAHDANSYDNKLNVYSGGIMELNTASPYVFINTVATGNAINMLSGSTLSYKGVTGVDMDAPTDASNGVSRFTWGGNNVLRLNNSSSATAAYTLTNTGATTTYATLELINGGSTSGTITVGDGGLLLGTGTSATTILDAGGTVSPGLSIGTLNGTDFTWNDGSMAFELSDTDNASDLLNLSGDFNKGAGNSFLFDFTGGKIDEIYTLVNFGATDFSVDDFGVGSGIEGTFILNPDNLQFNTSPAMAVIPEPSTLLIWALGLLGLGWYAWQKRN